MRLLEMKRRPTVFGKARIEYGKNPINRMGGTILIPNDNFTEIFPLEHEGKRDQFILARRVSSENTYWFGGTDENPFLVQLDSEPFNKFLNHGEVFFYDSLCPKSVVDLSIRVHRRWKRQGDIFAVPLNINWHNLLRSLQIARWGDASDCGTRDITDMAVYGTRHLLTGITLIGQYLHVYGYETPLIASGIIVAPDHSDLHLGGMPHALFQTAHLASPKNAD
jgi:hypothetical protein